MTVEHEPRPIQETGSSGEFLNRLLGLEASPFLPKWEDLPHNFHIPARWGEIIRQLANKTIRERREFGVLGYLPPSKSRPQDIRFGKLTPGDANHVVYKRKERRLFFFPYGTAVVDIHTHPGIGLKEKLASGLNMYNDAWTTIPSGIDLAEFLHSKERLLGFVVLPMGGGPTDIDILVKCQDTSLIGNEEYDQVIANFKRDIERFREKVGVGILHLANLKIFWGTVARPCRIGYYSSFNYLSLTHQELLPGKQVCLTKVYPYSSLDYFLHSDIHLYSR